MAPKHPKAKVIPQSPFLAPRRSSSYGGGSSEHDTPPPHTTANAISSDKYNTAVEPEHKSTAIGCTANLITAIVGAGIIGIPYAMRETGLLAGWLLILLSGILGSKSLRLLVETAKHVDAASYEILSETVFGKPGWVVCNAMMFMMSWGPMLSYQMLVKDTLPKLTGCDPDKCLIISSMCVMLPLSLQRDMADLAKTSRLSVLFNLGLVGIIAKYSPTSESISNAGGFTAILSQSTIRPSTCFIGLGIISFAFSCQHSSLIIAGSLQNPTRERWSSVSIAALAVCCILSTIVGTAGYCGFLEETMGNVLSNFPLPDEALNPVELVAAKAANVARGFLCGTMFFGELCRILFALFYLEYIQSHQYISKCPKVYPLESFVARHVIMTNLFQGRDAHEGDDHAVLDRWDRRVATTIAIYLSVLIPALNYNDVGIVLAWTGTVAATALTYIGPGFLFIGVHGQEFLDLAERKWGPIDGANPSFLNRLMWYVLLMPLWCKVASMGKRGLGFYLARKEMMTPANEFRLGKVRHKTRELLMQQKQRRSKDDFLSDEDCDPKNSASPSKVDEQISAKLGLITTVPENNISYGSIVSNHHAKNVELQREVVEDDCVEDDPQDEKQTESDFLVAISFVIFGVIAFTAGVVSILSG